MINMAVDIETTGLTPGVHEIYQMAFVAYDDQYNPIDEKTFKVYVQPTNLLMVDPKAEEMAHVNIRKLKDVAPTPAQVRMGFIEWKNDTLGEEKITPLGHNYLGFDKQFLSLFFKPDLYNQLFDYHSRDSMVASLYLMDRGRLPMGSVSLNSMCKLLGVPHGAAHDAYDDAVASLEVYKRLLTK